MAALRGDIADIEQQVSGQLSLHTKRPLLQRWHLPRRVHGCHTARKDAARALSRIRETGVVDGNARVERVVVARSRNKLRPAVVEHAVAAPQHRSAVLCEHIRKADAGVENIVPAVRGGVAERGTRSRNNDSVARIFRADHDLAIRQHSCCLRRVEAVRIEVEIVPFESRSGWKNSTAGRT